MIQANNYSILVNTKSRILTLEKNGSPYKSYKIAVGKPSTPTPKGVYKIVNKTINPGGPFGTRWLGLSIRRYGIHGTNRPSLIGQSVSNGCIRMYNNDVIELSSIVSIGTTVRIV